MGPERRIEGRLRDAVRASGGYAIKFISPGTAGVPDRLVLLPGGRAVFVELKAPGKKPDPLQLARHDQLRALGFTVEVLDSLDAVRGFMDRVACDTMVTIGGDTVKKTTFPLRLPEALHKALTAAAFRLGISKQKFCQDAIQEKIDRETGDELLK